MTWSDTHRYRYRLWFAAFVQVGILAGATYGWPNYVEVLERAGYYGGDADEQTTNLALIYTVGSWFNQGGRLLIGVYLDYFGVKITTATGCFMSAIGLIFFTFSTPSVNLLYPGFILISLGGPALQLATQSVSKLFENRAMVMASLTWAFQLSTLWFMLINVLNEGGISAGVLNGIYAGVAVILGIQCLWIWPRTFEGASQLKDDTESNSVQAGKKQPTKGGHGHSRQTLLSEERGYPADFLETATFLEMLKTPDYIMLNIWYSVYVLYLQFYVMTLSDQTEAATGESMAVQFGIVLCTFSATAIGMGYLIDKIGFSVPVLINSFVSMLAILLLSVESSTLQWFGFMLYVLSRVTTYGLFFAYIGINFGFRFFGTLAGLGMLISAFFSIFQYLCLSIVTGSLGGDYKPMNDFFSIWCLVWGILYALYLMRLECGAWWRKGGGANETGVLNPNASNYVIDPDRNGLDEKPVPGVTGGGAWD